MTAAVQGTARPKGAVDKVDAEHQVAVAIERLELHARQQRVTQLGADELALDADVEGPQGVENQLTASDKAPQPS